MKRKLSFLLIILFCAFAVKAQTELVSTGSGSAYEISYPAAFSYSSGITITFKAHAGSTAGPVTLNINGLGPKTIKKNVTADLALGDIMLNQYATVIYDGTNFQLTSSVPSSSTGVFATVANITSNSPGNFTLDDFVFGSPQLNNDADVNHYSRMYFDKSKSAFRAGYESGAGWNDVSVGNYSVAMGGFVRAMGAYSAAFGNSYADGDYSAALVRGQTSLGASESFSVGYGSYSRSPRAFSLGYFADVSGVNAIGLGSYVKTNASNAIVIGTGVGIGSELLNTTANSIMLGSNSNLPTLFISPSAGVGTSGKVGVGTTTPSGVLEVFDPVGYNGIVVSNNLSSAGSSVTFKTDDVNVRGEVGTNGSATATPNSLYITQYGAHPIKFATNSADRMLIDANGNVGIGTNTPTAKLQVYANSNAVTSASISGGASSLGAQRLSFSSGDVFDIGFQAAPNYAAWMQAGFNGTAEPILLNPLGGAIGIGNNNPTQALDVTGNIKFSGALMPNNDVGTAGQVLTSSGGGAPIWATPSGGLSGGTTNYLTKWTSGSTLSSTSLIYDDGTNVGIGTSSPLFALDVRGTGFTFAQVKSTGYAGLVLDKGAASDNNYLVLRTAGTDNWTLGQQGNLDLSVYNWTSSRNDLTIANATGNVGIGNSTPAEKLTVTGNLLFTQSSTIKAADATAGWGSALNIAAGNASAGHGPGTLSLRAGSAYSVALDGGDVQIFGGGHLNTPTKPGDIVFYVGQPSAEIMRIDGATTNIGIGTSAPTAKLHIGGISGVDGIRFPDGTLQTTAAGTGPWTKTGSTIYNTSLSENVGVGTASPTSRFHILGLNTTGPQFELSNFFSGTAFTTLSPTQLDAAGLFFHTAAISAVGAKSSIIAGGKTSGNFPSILAFYTTPTGGTQPTERLTIIGDGNVGINTATPSEKLEVNGNIEIPAANEYKYASAKTQVMSIPANAFRPFSSASGYSFVGTFAQEVTATTGATSFAAPIFLPDGSSINRVDIYVFDIGVGNIGGNLVVANGTGGAVNNPTGNTGGSGYQTISYTGLQIINNINNTYYVTCNLPAASTQYTICGAKVTYTITKAN